MSEFLRPCLFFCCGLSNFVTDIHKTAVIITDGESLLDDVTEPARKLRESGVEVFSIGVRDALQ